MLFLNHTWRQLTLIAYSTFVILGIATMTNSNAAADDATDKKPNTPSATPRPEDSMTILVGTYTNDQSRGVYQLRLNLDSGELGQLGLVAEMEQPSFLANAQGLPGYVVAVHETGEFLGQPGGGLSLLRYDASTGTATTIAQRNTQGAHPCHVVMNSNGSRIAVANYSGGSYTAYRLSTEREPGNQQPTELALDDFWLTRGFCFQNRGSSLNQQRQEAPHGHCVRFLPGRDDLILAADLGTDELLAFRVSETKADLSLEKIGSLKMKAGCGPRQLDFHPNGKWLYVINELDNTLSQVIVSGTGPAAADPAAADESSAEALGEMKLLSSIDLLPTDFTGSSSAAHLQVHPSGRFVYGSNRGHDSIAIFRIDDVTGQLTPCGHQTQGVNTPRHFLIEPTGKYLLVANQNRNTVIVFKINQETGELQPTSFEAAVPSPVCLLAMEQGARGENTGIRN